MASVSKKFPNLGVKEMFGFYENTDVNMKGKMGETLILAASIGKTDIILELLQKGVNINATLATGGTGLIVASYSGKSQVVKLLLTVKGIDIDATDKQGASALYLASQNGHVEIVDLLINANADCDTATNDGVTPLMIAKHNGYINIVDLLTQNMRWFPLTKLMRDEGYQYTSEGICYGLSCMSIQAMLVGDFDVLVKRLNIIKKASLNEETLVSRQKKIEIFAFLDGIQIYQNLLKFKELFNKKECFSQQHTFEFAFDINKPVFFQKNQINIYKIHSFSGCYKINQLKNFFKILEDTIVKIVLDIDTFNLIDTKFNNKISFILKTNDHSIALGYDYRNNTWTIVDENLFSIKTHGLNSISKCYNDKEKLIQLICLSFTENKVVGSDETMSIIIDIFIANQVDKPLQPIQDRLNLILHTNDDWKKLHEVISDKIDITNIGGSWLYMTAMQGGPFELLNKLIQAGANVNARTGKKNATPLRISVQEGYAKVVNILIEANANVNEIYEDGLTPLLLAVQDEGNFEVVDVLVNCRSDVNISSNDGVTPLFIAAMTKNSMVAKLLIKAKANVDCIDKKYGATAIYLAIQHDSVEIVDMLIIAKADLSISRKDGITPLWYAVQHGNIKMVDLLIQANADVNRPSNKQGGGSTPLRIASQNGQSEIAKSLIKAKANVDCIDKYSMTPLWIAAQNGHVGTVDLLLQYNADCSIANHEGVTPLDVAIKHNHVKIINKLKITY